MTFIEDCLEELKSLDNLEMGEYVGSYSKNLRSGQGQVRLENGDLYKGTFKNDLRHGTGVCKFKSGALYKGDFREDMPHGTGVLYSGKNEIIETRFEKGQIPNGRVKMILQDGAYYEGSYSNHRRHGQGVMHY